MAPCNEIKVAARIRSIEDYSGHADGSELARWIAARSPILRGLFLVHGEEPAIAGLAERISERIIPAARVFQPLLDDIYELSAAVPTPLDASHRRRLAPEAVVRLDWHNDMSKLVLDINDRIEAAAAIARAASSFEDYGVRWMNEKMLEPRCISIRNPCYNVIARSRENIRIIHQVYHDL